jgi:hypothetical protein
MRERVTAAGGHLEAGPQPGGCFRFSAILPLPAPVAGAVAGPRPAAEVAGPAGAQA